MGLFDIIKILFNGNNSDWKDIKEIDKSKNFFMINRFMSIMYPIQAQIVNRNGINGAGIVDMWQIILGQRYKKTPGWIYTKTKKAENKKEWRPTKELEELYIKRNEIKQEDFNMLLKLEPENMKAYFKKLEKQYNLQ